jgi:hypothetical protein
VRHSQRHSSWKLSRPGSQRHVNFTLQAMSRAPCCEAMQHRNCRVGGEHRYTWLLCSALGASYLAELISDIVSDLFLVLQNPAAAAAATWITPVCTNLPARWQVCCGNDNEQSLLKFKSTFSAEGGSACQHACHLAPCITILQPSDCECASVFSSSCTACDTVSRTPPHLSPCNFWRAYDDAQQADLAAVVIHQ